MILTILIWGYITVIVLLLGFGALSLLNRLINFQWQSLSFIWMLGLCLATVYSEYFSLFYKVGVIANVAMFMFVLLILGLEKKNIIIYAKNLWQKLKNESSPKVFLILLNGMIVLLFICIGCLRATHADTDLYHAQAIRWIEEYGVVKGLGNLHNRLAYNSAFMCLQALFSGAFLFNQSTHVVNTYIACGMFLYSFNTLFFYRKSNKVQSSDLFKVVILIYICNSRNLSAVSSPNTDTFALLISLFIFTKWAELLECRNSDESIYGVLCLLSVFACTLKLSTVMLLLLSLQPAICLIKRRQWKKIVVFIMSGLLIMAPFLIRNVMISGYLLYPYSQVDFFNLDWKMTKSVVDFDNKEIMAFGKGLKSYFLSDYPLKQWFPIWWGAQAIWLRILVILNILMIPGWFVINIVKMIIARKKNIDWNECFLFLTASAAFIFWLLSAPLARYGMVFAFGVPCVLLGKWTKRNRKILFQYIGIGICLLCFVSLGEHISDKLNFISIKRPSYYIFRECREIEWDGILIYVAEENHYCGYYYMPAATYEELLNYIELRGINIKDGFRVREEAKEIRFNNSGMLY